MITRPQESIEVILHRLNDAHWYQAIRGKTREHVAWLQSVTRYTKEAPKGIGLKLWMEQKGPEEAERLKQEGAIRGSAVHEALHILADGGVVKLRGYTREIAEHILSVKKWYDDIQPQFVATEEIVYNVDEKVAGTMDLRYVIPAKTCEALKIPKEAIREEIDGIHVAQDHKTSKALYEEHWLQANKYGYLRNDMGVDPTVGVPVEWIALLRTNSRHKCGYEFVIEPLCETRLQVFDCLKTVVDHFDPKDAPHFPKPLPESVTLYGNEQPAANGRHASNGRS